MKLEAMIVGERPNTFRTKTGVEVVERILRCADRDNTSSRVVYDYVMSEMDSKMWPEGSLLWKPVTIDIAEIRVDFGGAFKLKGSLQNGQKPVQK